MRLSGSSGFRFEPPPGAQAKSRVRPRSTPPSEQASTKPRIRRSFSASFSGRQSAGMDDPGAVLRGTYVDGRLDPHLPAIFRRHLTLELRDRFLADEAQGAAPEAGSRKTRAETACHRA